MSHITTCEAKITNIQLFCNIAKRIGHEATYSKQNDIIVKQFGRNEIAGCSGMVHLKDWGYPLAITPDGEIKYDHFGSKAGTMDYLGEALQEYNHQLIMDNMPNSEIQYSFAKTLDNGDKVITIQY